MFATTAESEQLKSVLDLAETLARSKNADIAVVSSMGGFAVEILQDADAPTILEIVRAPRYYERLNNQRRFRANNIYTDLSFSPI